MTKNKHALGVLALLGCTLIWGPSFVILKDALDSVPTLWILAIRFTGAMPRFEGYPVEEPSEERDDLTIWYPAAWDETRLNGWPESSRLSWKAYEP